MKEVEIRPQFFEEFKGIEIKQMPDQETLEDYLMGSTGHPRVIFDLEKGIFERTMEREQWLEMRRKSALGEMEYSDKEAYWELHKND